MKPKIQNMLKYFAIPLWAIHTTRGVRDVVKRIPKVHKRPPDTLHVACKRMRALGAHDHATACQIVCCLCVCFPAVMGHGFLLVWRSSWFSVFYKSSLFRVPDIFFAAQFFVLESQKMSKHASNARKSREPGTVRNRSWPFLAHGMLQLYMYNAAKLYFIVFWPLFHCARTGRERFWTVPDCSWFTGIPEFYSFTGFATISYWLSFFILTYGQCCHVAMALFSAFGKFKTESKNHRRTFPKHSLSVARGRANRTIYGMWLWLTSLSTCSLAIWGRRQPHVTVMFLSFAGVMWGSWRYHMLSPRLSYYITDALTGQVSQYSFQDLLYRFQDGF